MRVTKALTLAVLFATCAGSSAQAQGSQYLKQNPETKKQVAVKPASANPCAAFGAGFVRVEGSNTCVKLGGAISAGVGGAR